MEDQWKWATEFKELGKLANELGFRFAFETHMNYIHDTPAAAKKLADLIDEPSVGVNLITAMPFISRKSEHQRNH